MPPPVPPAYRLPSQGITGQQTQQQLQRSGQTLGQGQGLATAPAATQAQTVQQALPQMAAAGPPPPQAPDSPRQSQSPPPTGVQGDLEMELWGLSNALYNLGTTVINDLTKERDNLPSGKQVGQKVNDVVNHLATIDEIAQYTTTKIPMQILADIDNARNPMQLTKDRLERAATENQFMNAKIAAIASYREYLNEALAQNFPELELYLKTGSSAPPSSTI